MSQRLSISVIVPAFNAAHYLERSLPPLIAMRDRGEVSEVIVVDDCSTQASNIATARRLGATVLKTRVNGGPGAARNHASRRAIGDIVWFVDADVIAHASGPELIRKTFGDIRVTALFGSYDDHPPAQNFASQYKNLVHRYYHQRGREEASTFWAGCGAVRRAAFLAIGGFDRRAYRKPMIEDIELGHRLIDAGGQIRLVHDLLGTHLKCWSLTEVIRTDIFQRALPWSRLILRSGRPANDLNVSPAEKFRAVLAALWLMSTLALPGALLWSPLAFIFLGMSGVIALANWPIGHFFAKARGLDFSVTAVLYHQIYYVYSAAVFAFCIVEHRLTRDDDAASPAIAPVAAAKPGAGRGDGQ